MATAIINNVRLTYELNGTGETVLVLVHGSWTSRRSWDLIVPHLRESFRVLTYDRRGHSESERLPGPGSVHEDVADLAAMMETLELAPAWVVGNSFGASISLRLAAKHPDLVRGLIVHEPPLLALLADDPAAAPMLQQVGERVGAVVQRIAAGDHAGAAQQFVETVALGPGMWEQLPPDAQRILIENAPTFLDEASDPEQLAFDLESIKPFSRPTLMTTGEQSPPTFAPVVTRLARVVTHAQRVSFLGAGHLPHLTHPDAYVAAIRRFIGKQADGSGTGA